MSEYGKRDTDKVFSIEMQQPVELPGASFDVVLQMHREYVDKTEFAKGCNAAVGFNPTTETVYLEGIFSAEEVLAIYLLMQEDA